MDCNERVAAMSVLVLGEGEIAQRFYDSFNDYAMYGKYRMSFGRVDILPSATKEKQDEYNIVIDLYEYQLLRKVEGQFQALSLNQGAGFERLKERIDSEIDLLLSV